MKKLVAILFLFISTQGYALTTGIENAIDGNGRAIQLTIDTRTGLSNYKSYSDTTTADVTIDAYTALGRFVSSGMFINDSVTSSISLQFSVDGTTFGDSLVLKAGEKFDMTSWIVWKKVKLVYSGPGVYRLIVR